MAFLDWFYIFSAVSWCISLFADKSQGEEEVQADKQVGGFSSHLPGHEIWSPTVYTGTTTPPEAASITHTPITQVKRLN